MNSNMAQGRSTPSYEGVGRDRNDTDLSPAGVEDDDEEERGPHRRGARVMKRGATDHPIPTGFLA